MLLKSSELRSGNALVSSLASVIHAARTMLLGAAGNVAGIRVAALQ